MNDSLEIAGADRVAGLAARPRKRIVVVGAPRDARRLLRDLHARPVPIIGFIDAGHHRKRGPRARDRHLAVNSRANPLPVLGDIDRVDQIVEIAGATHVLVAHSRPRKHLRPRLARLADGGVSVHWIAVGGEPPDLAELDLDVDAPAPVLRPTSDPRSIAAGVDRWLWTDGARLAKRAADVLISALLLTLLAPLFLLVALVILLTDGGPIFYTQERVGQGGRPFRIIKFRSMRSDAEAATGPVWASEQDARCTRFGQWLRRSNVDETPQLFNVLKGEMSLVGPRPERPVFVERFRAEMPDYNLRHAVPCGMTGWAQVHGWRGRTSLRKRVQYDLDYINRWSFWLDFRILFMTVQHVAWGKISWNNSPTPRKTEP